jgi:hypothetical protein
MFYATMLLAFSWELCLLVFIIMATIRRNLSLTEANHKWLSEQAPTEKAFSSFINNLLQRERTLGPLETKMSRHLERMEAVLQKHCHTT